MEIPEIEFDHHSPEFVLNHQDLYSELRSQCPVAHTSAHGGYWVVASYDDVSKVARNDAVFSSARDVVIPVTNVGRLIPLQSDPPELRRFRGLLNPYFTARHLDSQLKEFIKQRIDECIDAFIEDGQVELMDQLANPIPSSVTMRLLGLNPSDWNVFAHPIHAASYAIPGSPEHTAAMVNVNEFSAIIESEVHRRVTNPRQDMISELLASEWEGVKTSVDEVVDLTRMVIFAGMDTVMASLGNIFVRLGERPDIRDQLVKSPQLLPGAIEEFLRFDTAVQGFARTVTEETELGGIKFKPSDTVFMLWASANRDPAHFGEDSDSINIERKPNRHMTFGVGAHFCIGAALARLQLNLTLSRTLERIPDLKIDLANVKQPASIGIVKGLKSVPGTFTPGKRIKR
jgi:cytochrome P450